MNALREAAQMALDAMLNFPDDISDDMFESIKALRAALAQPNDFSPDWDAMAVMVEEQQRMAKRIEELEAQLEQPEQEPEPYCYTWDVWISGGYWEARYGWEPYCGGKRPAHSTEAKPLYTAPPQREWQGLTDEDIEDACWTEVDQRLCSFARAIEAALRSKNT